MCCSALQSGTVSRVTKETSYGRSLLQGRVSRGGVGDGLTEVLPILWLYRGNVVSMNSHHIPEDAWSSRGAWVGSLP